MDAAETSSLLYKPDWPQAQRRWIAFWDRQPTDRPCLDLRGPRPVKSPPPPQPQDPRDCHMNPDVVARRVAYFLESTFFGGEAVPTPGYLLGAYALGCGSGAVFTPETVWFPVLMGSLDEPLAWKPGPDDPWRRRLTDVVSRLLDLAPGKFLVGHICPVDANDLLPLIRGSEDFLLELADDWRKCLRRLREMLPLRLAEYEHFRRLIEARQKGCVWGWPGLWHPRQVMLTQSDMSCMISTELFDRYVMPELDFVGEYCPLVWYHLDGRSAIHHLPALLGRSYIRAIQFVATTGHSPNGPAYLDLYRAVQSAGRCLDLNVPLNNLEYLIRRLRPEGLVLRTWVKTQEQAEEILSKAPQWAGTHANSAGP